MINQDLDTLESLLMGADQQQTGTSSRAVRPSGPGPLKRVLLSLEKLRGRLYKQVSELPKLMLIKSVPPSCLGSQTWRLQTGSTSLHNAP